ncbi:STE like transcription factor-domain-containing protein [Cladochytrium replicatum]|nr:STE like transcription factor-domain-containing protein [Cladochytrium replicatum]
MLLTQSYPHHQQQQQEDYMACFTPPTSSAQQLSSAPTPAPSATPSLATSSLSLNRFLATATKKWDYLSAPARRFQLTDSDFIACVFWNNKFYISGTDIIRTVVFRFNAIGRTVVNMKKLEEGVFSDLRNLKPGFHASLEEPRSPFLDLLYKNGCIRTQKKQKVFHWHAVRHDALFMDALERDLKRESQGVEPTTVSSSNMSVSEMLDLAREHCAPYSEDDHPAEEGEQSLTAVSYEAPQTLFASYPNPSPSFTASPPFPSTHSTPMFPSSFSTPSFASSNSTPRFPTSTPLFSSPATTAATLMSTPLMTAHDHQYQPSSLHTVMTAHPHLQSLPSTVMDCHRDSNGSLVTELMGTIPQHIMGQQLLQPIATPLMTAQDLARTPMMHPMGTPIMTANELMGPAPLLYNFDPTTTPLTHPISPNIPTTSLPLALLPAPAPWPSTPPSHPSTPLPELDDFLLPPPGSSCPGPASGGPIRAKSYPCSVPMCSRTFKRFEHLRRHIRCCHTAERPYVCDAPGCGRSFSRSDNLTQHSKVHTGEVPALLIEEDNAVAV